MDFAEAEYVSRLRSGVKGHFSYRNIAWKMKEKMDAAGVECHLVIPGVSGAEGYEGANAFLFAKLLGE